MLIDEAKYNWLRTNPIEILVEDNSNNIEFEKALHIYHIEDATELSILLPYLSTTKSISYISNGYNDDSIFSVDITKQKVNST